MYQLGKNARQLVIERYTWEKHVEKILSQSDI
jgi:glycosyltransferase involved in cell wall biosynthesis